MSAERWLPVVGWEDRFEVSNQGRLRSISGARRLLKQGTTRTGYAIYNLNRGRACRKLATVHSLVTAAFVGPRPDGLVTRHLDGNKQNNALSNLRYGTAEENWADRHRLGEFVLSVACPYGHPFDAENTYDRPNASGRTCRVCHCERNRAYRARKQDAALRMEGAVA